MPTPEPVAPAPPPPSVSKPTEAVLWMVATGLCFVAVTAIVKELGGRVPAAQAAFLRYFLGLVWLIPAFPALFRMQVGARVWAVLGIRGFVHSLAVILWFFAMAQITMAEVTAMNYLTPVAITLGAAVFLGERLHLRRIVAVTAALVGALLILRPGVRPLELGHIAMIGTALLFAVSYLIAKRLTETIPPARIVALLSVMVTLGLLPFALAVWAPVSLADLAWLALVSGFATAGHIMMTLAFRAGPMTVTQPVTFLQLVWAVGLGAVWFGEPADIWVIAGGGVILASVCFIAIREAQLRARRVD